MKNISYLLFVSLVFLFGMMLGASSLLAKNNLLKSFAACDKYPYLPDTYEQSERYKCYVEKILSVTATYGPREAIGMIEEYRKTSAENTISEATCHNLGHHVGEIAAKKGFDRSRIINECGASCVGGCLNGAVHYYLFSGAGVEELEEFCKIRTDDKDLTYACFHGIGHALVEYSRIDLVKTMQECTLIKDPQGREQCGHAAVMDYGISLSAPNPNLPENAAEFCASQDEIMRVPCFEFAGFIEYSRTTDIERAFKTCRKIDPNLQAKCQRRVAEAAADRYEGRFNELIDQCAKGNEEEFYNCALHTVQVFRNSVSPDQSFIPAEMCRKLPQNRYTECLAEVDEIKDIFNLTFQE